MVFIFHTLEYGKRDCQYHRVWRQSLDETQATGKERLGEPTLTASDWAEAALQLIAEKGLGALTVGALRRGLA